MLKGNKKLFLINLTILMVLIFAFPNNALAVPAITGYQDNESANGNEFTASSLDAEVTSTETELQLPATAADMLAGEIVTRDGKIENVENEDFKYNVSFDKVSGSDALCAALQVTARRNLVAEYTGNLSGLDFDATLNSGDHNDWDFSIELPLGSPANLQNLDCDFNFIFTAWQTNFAGPTQGWIDEEEIDNNNIHTGDWTAPVISNVVDYDPSTTRRTANRVNIRVTWTTDELATSKVVYDTVSHAAGTPADYLFKMPALDDVLADRTSHTQTLGNLNPNNTYYYRVVNRDAIGNTAYSIEYVFDISDPKPGTVGNIVMNEFIPDPAGNDVRLKPNGEWIELYNSTLAAQDVAGWYLKNSNGDVMVITTTNSDNNGNFTDAGETIVPAGRYLVVFVNSEFTPNDFLDNAADTLELYDATNVLMDSYTYVNTFASGKSFARIPDGGFWVDPDVTPGHENELGDKEMDMYRAEAFEKCFSGQDLKANAGDKICNIKFLDYIGMIKGEKGSKIPDDLYAKFISVKEKEKLEKEAEAKDLLEKTAQKETEASIEEAEIVAPDPENTSEEEIIKSEKIEIPVDIPTETNIKEPEEKLPEVIEKPKEEVSNDEKDEKLSEEEPKEEPKEKEEVKKEEVKDEEPDNIEKEKEPEKNETT